MYADFSKTPVNRNITRVKSESSSTLASQAKKAIKTPRKRERSNSLERGKASNKYDTADDDFILKKRWKKDEWKTMTLNELKEALAERGISSRGKKAMLIESLKEYLEIF